MNTSGSNNTSVYAVMKPFLKIDAYLYIRSLQKVEGFYEVFTEALKQTAYVI